MYNRVGLIGRLTKDVNLRYTPAGDPVATFTVAVNRVWEKPGQEDGKHKVDFFNIVVWGKSGENCANYLRKGSLCSIDGRLQSRNYEGNDGKRVFVTEVKADSVQFLEPKGEGTGQSNDNSNRNQQETHTFNGDDPFAGSEPVDIPDDDWPF
ncbi:single-stranded DNA-binding protein [Bacillus salitolerans]|uniref:Single-stranded DNA-binding protein n=1 Tax=Bacillus salitolerans TaxID=1437434 RepID=A0ABW4LNU5_9BACI